VYFVFGGTGRAANSRRKSFGGFGIVMSAA
jgi:hypothetical protein